MFSGWPMFLALGLGALCAVVAIRCIRLKESDVIAKDREQFLREMRNGKSN